MIYATTMLTNTDVQGWLKSNTIHMLDAKELIPPPDACLIDEIVTEPSWRWFKTGGGWQNSVIVPFYDPVVAIPPTTQGVRPRAIWSEINSGGLATCSNCQYSFWYDYILPNGFKVTEATVNLQSDDFAYLYVNYFQAGFADYSTTFQINSYRTFTVPDYLFQNGTNTISLSFTAQNNFNYAAIASKIRIKRCPS